MKQCDYLSRLASGIALAYLTIASPLQAQIVPDTTLPNNSSVTPQGNTNIITGGTRAGSNLFHSFEQFSVPTNGAAYFNNAGDIQNILSRVTGSSVSNIDGLLRANGTANLFLLNPNGIIFGPNASLNIGGSFLASTASSLNFADNTQFSATAPQATPLLTVSAPIGFQFGETPGSIRNQSQVFSDDPTNFFGYPVGLQVQPGKTLALIGGDIALEGGYLTAEGGRIELGSFASGSLVSLNPTDEGWALGYEGVQSFQDIQLSQGAYVDASGEGGGNIQVQGRRITLTDGSQIGTLTQGTEPGGTLTMTASESVELVGTSADGLSGSGLFSQATGSKAAGDLTIETGRLLVQNGAQVSTGTFGTGQGGDLTVTASESVELVGTSASGLRSSLLTQTRGSKAAGDLTIETGRLLIRDGAQVSAATFGAGQGGDLTVTASESVELVDVARKVNGSPFTNEFGNPFSSGLFTQTHSKEGTGAGGNLSIFTKKLTVREGALLNSATSGTKDAGNLTVQATEIELIGAVLSANGQLLTKNGLPFTSGLFAGTDIGSEGNGGTLTVRTDRLSLRDGAVLQTTTFGAGNAGDLRIRVSESVELIGKAKGSQNPSGLLAVSGGIPGFRGVVEATGQGGSIDLEIGTGQLLIRDGAAIAVSSINPNNNAKGAGNIKVAAPTISLDNGDIRATTASGQGGSIAIQVPNLLLLRRNSNVSTSAGSAQVGGDGGNIKIDTNFIVAAPQENSDITANAFSGSGGEVNIQVQGEIFGLEPRSRQELQTLLETDNPSELDPSQLPSNDITAISQTNPSLSGQVTINTPDVDPSQGLSELPDVPVDVEVAQGCQTGGKQASVEFFNTGKGGLAPSPYEPLSSSEVWEDVPQGAKTSAGAARAATSPATPPDKIVEAQGWLVNEKGEAVLVAEVPATHFHRCHLR